MHPYFNIFGSEIPAYTALWLIGCAAAVCYIALANRRARLDARTLVTVGAIALICGALGAKLLYFITRAGDIVSRFSYYTSSFSVFLNSLILPGFVFYGGLLGGLLGAWAYFRATRMDGRDYFDLLIPAVPLFHAFGRLGCFLSGCCYGVECEFGIVLAQSHVAPNDVPLFPVQLVEAACCLAIFVALLLAKHRRGWAVWMYLFAYSAVRFVLEFLRGDDIRGHIWIFSTSQWISLAILACVLFVRIKDSRSSDARRKALQKL